MSRNAAVVVTLSALLAVLAGLVLLPVRAQADPADDAVSALRTSNVYVGAATPSIDRASLPDSELNGIKVAILPTGGPDPVTAAKAIGARLDPGRRGLTVLVFEGRSYGAASTAVCDAGTLISDAVDRNRATLQSGGDVTTTVRDFAAGVRAAPPAAEGCNPPTGANGQTAVGQSGRGSPVATIVTIAVLLALLLGGVAWLLSRRRRRARLEIAEARAEVMPYYDRLANEIVNLDPKDNDEARQSLADAAERLGSAGDQLSRADSVASYAAAGRTVLEGLYAARAARTALGLPVGPPLPPVAQARGASLDRPSEVTVEGRSYQGYPTYTPGAPYYYAGGWGIPGGWYGVPFWQTLMLGGLLGGGLGWGWGGGWGGYDAGYGAGYDSGFDAGQDAAGGTDAGWGDSGGGGSWGAGWGDTGVGDSGGWGDSGGGGDWGGGDWGGGDGGSW